jgi:hypothetical protein
MCHEIQSVSANGYCCLLSGNRRHFGPPQINHPHPPVCVCQKFSVENGSVKIVSMVVNKNNNLVPFFWFTSLRYGCIYVASVMDAASRDFVVVVSFAIGGCALRKTNDVSPFTRRASMAFFLLSVRSHASSGLLVLYRFLRPPPPPRLNQPCG